MQRKSSIETSSVITLVHTKHKIPFNHSISAALPICNSSLSSSCTGTAADDDDVDFQTTIGLRRW